MHHQNPFLTLAEKLSVTPRIFSTSFKLDFHKVEKAIEQQNGIEISNVNTSLRSAFRRVLRKPELSNHKDVKEDIRKFQRFLLSPNGWIPEQHNRILCVDQTRRQLLASLISPHEALDMLWEIEIYHIHYGRINEAERNICFKALENAYKHIRKFPNTYAEYHAEFGYHGERDW